MFILSQNKISVADPEHMLDYIEWYITHMVYYIKYMCIHIYVHICLNCLSSIILSSNNFHLLNCYDIHKCLSIGEWSGYFTNAYIVYHSISLASITVSGILQMLNKYLLKSKWMHPIFKNNQSFERVHREMDSIFILTVLPNTLHNKI